MNKAEKLLDKLLLSRLTGRADLKQIIANSGWLIFEKVYRLGLGFFINLQVTNYLGSSEYGAMNNGMAFAVLFSPFATLGLDSILNKKILQKPSFKEKYLNTTFSLKALAAFICLLLGTISAWWFFGSDSVKVWVAALQFTTFLFLSLDVFETEFNSRVKSKYPVYSKNLVFTLGAIVKLIALSHNAPMLFFALVQTLELSLHGIIIWLIHKKKEKSTLKFQIDKPIAKEMLKESLPFALSTLIVIIYMRIDQLMLGKMISDSESGIYTAAVRLSEIWYFIPLSLIASFTPAITKIWDTDRTLGIKKMTELCSLLFYLSIGVGIVTNLTAHWIIKVYNPEFHKAADILVVNIWAGIFVSFGSATAQFFVLENLGRLNFYRAFLGMIVNIILNLFLIPHYGALGAAIATLLGHGTSALLGNFIFKKTMPLNLIFINSLNPLPIIKSIRG